MKYGRIFHREEDAMGSIAAFDIGTTAVKAALVSAEGVPLYRCSQEIPTLVDGDFREQDPRVWWEAFCSLFQAMRKVFPKEIISGIIMSGQMQDVIALDENLEPVCPAILYSDGRAVEEAGRLVRLLGEDYILRITGNHMDGSLSLPKILWLKKHRPEVFGQARHFLISSKDYIIARLTGRCTGDYTACSTAGAMDLANRSWAPDFLAAAGIAPDRMPVLYASHQLVDRVTAAAARLCGCDPGIPVYAGTGDAGATTLASGIMEEGQYNINLGTSGWVATVSSHALFNAGGIFNLAAMPPEKVINVVPFLNAGNVHQWAARLFSPDGQPDYLHTKRILEHSIPGSHGVFALPYLVGERFPVLDAEVRGTFTGLTPETTPEDLTRAMLEGVSFSIRQGMEMLGRPPVSVSVIGGGARVVLWCQMLADVLDFPIDIYPDADTLPAQAIAAAARISSESKPDYTPFIHQLRSLPHTVYSPSPQTAAVYKPLYRKYLSLYTTMRSWYHQ